MPRYRLLVEYDGRGLVGWQRQAVGRSAQGLLEDAALAFSGEPAAVRGAGRTDAGVHATGQVAHLDLAAPRRPDVVRDAMNAHLRRAGAAVAVLAADLAPEGFDARFSATRRRYLYRLLNRRAPAALDLGRAWHVPVPLDERAMALAAARLLGRHDFTTFRAAGCQASGPVRTLDALDVARAGEVIEVRAAARSFLHHQVRAMVGTLAEVGRGKRTPDDVAAALAARDRARCGPMAPPDGLALVGVEYGGEGWAAPDPAPGGGSA